MLNLLFNSKSTFISIFSLIVKFSLYNLLILLLILLLIYIIKRFKQKKSSSSSTKGIAFLHPNASDFGGGEKVLWEIVKALSLYQSDKTNGNINKIYILCSNKCNLDEILIKLNDRFNLTFDKGFDVVKNIQLVKLNNTSLVAPKRYFTMLLQIIGQVILAFEIILTVHTEYIIDTTGLPFTYFLLKLYGFKVGAYIHYPFISDQMIDDVRQDKVGVHNKISNDKQVLGQELRLTKSQIIKKKLKLVYYSIINVLFKFNCRQLEFAMSNSTWTFNHMKKIFGQGQKHGILYPPCSVDEYKNPLDNNRRNVIVSFAQFRPEKDHQLQIEILERLRSMGHNIKLEMVGSIRHEDDKRIVSSLERMIISKGLQDYVSIHINLPMSEIKDKFKSARFGIHTMKDEHFGIALIEMMSSGLILFAHNSAGPRFDIIGSSSINSTNRVCGFLANDKEEFIDCLNKAIQKPETYLAIQTNAREKVQEFSIQTFRKKFISSMEDLKIL